MNWPRKPSKYLARLVCSSCKELFEVQMDSPILPSGMYCSDFCRWLGEMSYAQQDHWLARLEIDADNTYEEWRIRQP